MTRAETPGFIAHARLMLTNALNKASDDWDDPDVQLTPAQTADMRRNMRDINRLMRSLEPYVKGFERVSETRTSVLIGK